MLDEGYIKFKSVWTKKPLSVEVPGDLKRSRDQLFTMGLIGFDTQLKVGFGNISCRINDSCQFLISGTQTGGIERIQDRHFTLVSGFSISNNTVVCEGPVEASSESMTHAALYLSNTTIGSVIHFHHREFWETYLEKLPTTANTPYGTPQMAEEISELAKKIIHQNLEKIIIMKGHQDGVLAFGRDFNEIIRLIEERLNLL